MMAMNRSSLPLLIILIFACPVLQAQDHNIVISSSLIDEMVQERELLLMRSLTSDEKTTMVQEYVYDEILIREAIKFDLHLTNDEVRETLISIMAFSLEPKADKPTEDELRAYFDANRADFDLPPNYTFDHIYVSNISKLSLKEVKESEQWQGLGEEHWSGHVVEGKPAYEIMLFLGETVAEQIKYAPLDEWVGPLPSPLGKHFIRVTDKTDPQPLSFEVSEERVRTAWINNNKARKFHERVMALAPEYSISLPEDYQTLLQDHE